jgi:hypothetical protein
MAAGYTTRKLQVFSLHARVASGVADYLKLGAAIAAAAPNRRQAQRGDRLVALSGFDLSNGVAWLIAHEGALDQNPLIFDRQASKDHVGKLSPGEVVATRTHSIVDFKRREAIIEYNHQGAKASDIAEVLAQAGTKALKLQWLEVELNPKADQTFLADLERFKRIRLANVKMAIPNAGWTDYKSHMTQMAEESNGRMISVEISAGRTDGLSRGKGLIALIREAASAAHSPLKGAQVTGYREEENATTTISLAKHIEHQRIEVRLDKDGHVDSEDIKRKIYSYHSARVSGGAGGD